MNSAESLKTFFESIRLESTEPYEEGLRGVAKRLNESYWELSSDSEHLNLVGSVGRGTAVDGASDADVLFILPNDVKVRFDKRQGNVQSQLLTEVKEELRKRYSNTDMRSDGQAVVIDFKDRNYTIDLVPVFERSDGAYTYPDTHDGGSWKRTDPDPEQEACLALDGESDGNFVRICNALRVWKDNVGFTFGGLLIDTLAGNFLDKHDEYMADDADAYLDMVKEVFRFLANEDSDQSYWYAIGSNQYVYNTGNGKFVAKAKKAMNLLDDDDVDNAEALKELFGKRFDDCIVEDKMKALEREWVARYQYQPDTEEFIEDRCPVHIRYDMELDCDVTQKGFRPDTLRSLLRRKLLLPREKQLDFKVKVNIPGTYQLYWKVCNCGEEAYRRRMVRGQIVPDNGRHKHHEHTDFAGAHSVECYAVQNGVCVARQKIEVPISS